MNRRISFSLVATAVLFLGCSLPGAEETQFITKDGAYQAKRVAVRTLEEPIENYSVKVLGGSNFVAFASKNSLHVLPSNIGVGNYQASPKGPAVNLKSVLADLAPDQKLGVEANEFDAVARGGQLFLQSNKWIASASAEPKIVEFLGSGTEPASGAKNLFNPSAKWPVAPLAISSSSGKDSASVLSGRGSEAVVTKGGKIIVQASELGFGIYDMKPSPDGKQLLLYAGDTDYYLFDHATSKVSKLNLEGPLGKDTLQSVAWGNQSGVLFAVACSLSTPKNGEEEPQVIGNGLIAINLGEKSVSRISMGEPGKLMDLEGDPNRLQVLFAAKEMLAVGDAFSNEVNLLQVSPIK